MSMNTSNQNRKYVFFLVGLSLFGVILYKNFEEKEPVITLDSQKVQTQDPIESTVHSVDCFANEEISPILVNDYVDIELEEPLLVNSSEVLGANGCDYFEQQYNIGALCDDASENAFYDDGEGSKILIGSKDGGAVKKERTASIQLVKVTYPSQFWNGSKVVKDSTKSISKSDPVYLSSGDYLSLDYGQKLLTPVEVNELGDGTNRLPFAVVANNYIEKALEKVKEMGVYIINREDNEDHYSLCDRDIQPSAFNPTLTNRVGEILSDSLQIPGGDPKESTIQSNCVATENSPEYILDDKDAIETGCNDGLVARFLGNITSYFTETQWHNCTVGSTTIDEDGNEVTREDICATPEKIVVEMTSLFGLVDECSDGVCGNAGLSRRFLATETPGEATAYKSGSSNYDKSLTVSILTPCKVELDIAGDLRGPKLVDVYCKWDASPSIANYRAEAIENVPNDEDFPQSYDEYWSLVEKAIARDSKLSVN